MGIRAGVKLKCDNMKEENKYWLREKNRIYTFCEQRKGNTSYFTEECKITQEIGLKIQEKNKKERLNKIWNDKLNKKKDRTLRIIIDEKEKKIGKRNEKEKGNKGQSQRQ